MKNKNLTIAISFLLLSFFLIETVSAQFERSVSRHEVALSKIQSTSGHTTNYFDDAGMDSLIEDIMTRYHIAGGAYCVLKDGEIVWKQNKGYANIEKNRLVSDSTLFTMASISKTFTATALMQLWEEGLFELDDDINHYLPEDLQVHHYYYPEESITFRMLLTHTSGLKDNWGLLDQVESEGDPKMALDSFLIQYFNTGGEFYSKNNFYNMKPGVEFQYCNVAFGLIGYLVEAITGIAFDQYCETYLFVPLGITNSAWFLSQIDPADMAMPYKWEGQSYSPYGHISDPIYPCGFLKTSLTQLAHFLSLYMINTETLLDSTTMNMMVKDHLELVEHPDGDTYRGQGLCWYEQLWGNEWVWGHTGGWYGVANAMFYNKDENYGFIDLTNTGFHDTSTEGFFIISEYLAEFAGLWGKIYAFRPALDKYFIPENTDSLLFQTRFVNREEHLFTAQIHVTSLDSTVTDSFALFDDGIHNDGANGDGIWAASVPPLTKENEIIVSVSTRDQQNGDYFKSDELTRFTSIGPVVLCDTTHVEGTYTDRYRAQYLKLRLRNEGMSKPATNLKVQLSTDDPRVLEVADPVSVGDLAPGEEKLSYLTGFKYIEGYGPDSTKNNPIRFACIVSSSGYPFWTDSLDYVTPIEEAGKQPLPLSFRLEQNYPNPFNPKTTIEYQIPKTCQVDLNIYNTLGQKVATLVSQKQTAGNYEIEWNASGFASGVYYYHLQAGDYREVKKMIILK